MKKVLILGSGGMLGHVVYHYLKSLNNYEIIDTSNRIKTNTDTYILDITKKSEVEDFVKKNKPDIVINCIGVLIKGSLTNAANAIYINSYFPHQLSNLVKGVGGRLIHISTDCVFAGAKGSYIETDHKDAEDTYGLSKSLGEINNEHDLTIRTSIIGPELKENGEGLFHWFSHQTGEINGFTRMYWGGVTTLELAKVIHEAINQDLKGLINITNGISISKYDLLNIFKRTHNYTSLRINKVEGKDANKSLKSIRTDFKYVVPDYETMIKDQRDWILEHPNLYINNYSLLFDN